MQHISKQLYIALITICLLCLGAIGILVLVLVDFTYEETTVKFQSNPLSQSIEADQIKHGVIPEGLVGYIRAYDTAGLAPIHYCILKDDLSTLRSLLKLGVDINTPIRTNAALDGYTSLHLAAMYHRTKLLSFLLENGAIPTLAGIDGIKPIDIAIDVGNQQDIRLLTEFTESKVGP